MKSNEDLKRIAILEEKNKELEKDIKEFENKQVDIARRAGWILMITASIIFIICFFSYRYVLKHYRTENSNI